MKKIILILVWSCILVSCGHKKEDSKYLPKLNVSPKFTFTVSGYIDKTLKNDSELVWTAIYRSTNKKCRYTDDYLAGSRTYRVKKNIFKLKDDGVKYKHKFYIDKYTGGFCGWRLSGISYNLSLNGSEFLDTVFFNTNAQPNVKLEHRKAVADIVCKGRRKMTCNENIVSYFTKETPSNLEHTKDYMYELNVVRK